MFDNADDTRMRNMTSGRRRADGPYNERGLSDMDLLHCQLREGKCK